MPDLVPAGGRSVAENTNRQSIAVAANGQSWCLLGSGLYICITNHERNPSLTNPQNNLEESFIQIYRPDPLVQPVADEDTGHAPHLT